MGPTELHALQLAGAQEFVDGAATDIEQLGSAIDGNGQAIVEIDEVSATTFAHVAKIGGIARALISFKNLASFCAGHNLRLSHPALQLLCFCSKT
jgi:hypothetical protein